jgi:hypothetical protein
VLDWAVEDVLGVRVSDALLCGCDTGIRITKTKQTLKLETNDRHSHIGGTVHARKSAPGVGGFSRQESEGSANDESGGWISSFIVLTFLPCAADEHNDLRRVAANVAFELIRAAGQPPSTGGVAPPRN